jgi:hypothetical protein
VPLEAAEPPKEPALAAVPEDTTQPEYVYLSLVDKVIPRPLHPSAKIPTVAFPAAAPPYDEAVAAVAEPLVHAEYVNLFLVVVPPPVHIPQRPRANMPMVLVPTADPRHEPKLALAAVAFVSDE